MLIMLALRRNTPLLNKSKTKFLRSVVVPGIINTPGGYGKGHSAQKFQEGTRRKFAAWSERTDCRAREIAENQGAGVGMTTREMAWTRMIREKPGTDSTAKTICPRIELVDVHLRRQRCQGYGKGRQRS